MADNEKAVAKAKDTKATEKADKSQAKSKAKKSAKPSLIERIKKYFSDVRKEVKQVTWPSREDLIKYSVAVVVMLLFFGILIAVVDNLIVAPGLVAFANLRG